MTVKLNLNPLINYFGDKNKTIANRLDTLTKKAQEKPSKPFESAFLGEEGLKEKVDSCTSESLEDCKNAVAKVISESSHFGKANKIKHLKVLQSLQSPQKLQFFFYNYILAASRMKASSAEQFKKLASTLVEIADELDTTDPELAAEADAILKELYKQAAGCGSMEMGHTHSEKCMGPGMGSPEEIVLVMEDSPKMMAPMGGEYLMEEAQLEKPSEPEEPEIEEMKEPEPEFDTVSLKDIEDRLANMKWRVADRKSREALEQAIEHIQKAEQHHHAKKNRMNKVHELFDHAGLALRVKDFE